MTARQTAADQLARMEAAMSGPATQAATTTPKRTRRQRAEADPAAAPPAPKAPTTTSPPAAPAPAGRPPRRKFRPGQPREVVRYSMVLDAPQRRTLRLLTADHAIDAADIFRAVIDLMNEDSALTERIVARIVETYS